jgi:hypothetical protein
VPLLLRVVRKAKWYKNPDVPWLRDGDLQADAIADLRTTDNRLSVWHIEDDQSNLRRVAAAYAAGRDSIANFDYAIFNTDVVDDLGVIMDDQPGNSPDSEANEKWRRNLGQFSHRQLFEFAEYLRQSGTVKRMQYADVLESLRQAWDANQLDDRRVKEKILSQLRGDVSN